MKLRGIELDIDYLEELDSFDVWDKQRVRENKFQACSPFRHERHPSFAVNLENGLWIDSGSPSEEWRAGNFVTLLSFLRQETPEETIDYLVTTYAPFNVDVDTLSLDLQLQLDPTPPKVFTDDEVAPYVRPTDYLSGRGVSERVQKEFSTGYDEKGKGIALPWHNKHGQVINIKFRSLKDKYFWYAEGQAIKYHVFGLFLVNRLMKDTVYIVESEIDALYLWSHGFPAIALGRAGMSEAQKELILNSPIKRLVIATDNDKAGWRAGLQIIKDVHGLVECRTIDFPDNVKDVNDMPPNILKRVCKNHRPIHFRIVK